MLQNGYIFAKNTKNKKIILQKGKISFIMYLWGKDEKNINL